MIRDASIEVVQPEKTKLFQNHGGRHCSSSYSIPVGGRFFFLFWCFYGNWPINIMDWSVKHWMVHRRAIEHYSDEVFFLGQPGILHHPGSLIKMQQDFSIGLWSKLLQSDLTTCFLREVITSEYYWKKVIPPCDFLLLCCRIKYLENILNLC